MRPMIVSLVALAMTLSIAVLSAGAQFNVGFLGGPVNQGVPFVFTCGSTGAIPLTAAMPFSQGSYLLQAFNASTLAHADTEALAIAFPSLAGAAPENLPPFGPTIAQAKSETIVAARTYFFNDFLSG